MKTPLSVKLAITLLGLVLTASCENMLTGNDVTAQVQTQVAVANAQQVPVTVQVDPNNIGGTISSQTTTAKVGISFPIVAVANNDAAFKNWTWTGDGTLTIASTTLASTTATLTKAPASTPMVIQANFYTRPTVMVIPSNGASNVFRNQPIQLQFSNKIGTASMPRRPTLGRT
jgi:hypothetical protein